MNSIFHSPLKRRILLVILGIIVWAAIAIPITLDFIDYGKDKLAKNDHLEYESDAQDQVQFDFKILSTDLAKRTIKVYVEAYPIGIYRDSDNYKWDRTVELQFMHKNYMTAKGTTLEPVTFDIPLTTGNLMEYPFDKYTADIEFYAIDNTTSKYIPATIYSSIYNQNTETSLEVIPNDLNGKAVKIKIKRPPMIFAFCFFISCVTWSLTIVVFNIAMDYLFFKREIPDGHLSIGIGLLFAMPALRKAQPEIPEIGCAIDFLCFIWCETLIGVSASMILFSWLLRFNITAPPSPPQV